MSKSDNVIDVKVSSIGDDHVIVSSGRLRKIEKAILSAIGDTPNSYGAGESFDKIRNSFQDANSVCPPYDPYLLSALYEDSTALRPNIEAYATAIDAFGYRLESRIDIKAEDADERLADAVFFRKLSLRGCVDDGTIPDTTPEEIKSERTRVSRRMKVERQKIKSMMASCSSVSFERLRVKKTTDLEVTGNAYIEVIRNNRGEPARLEHAPSVTMRLMPIDETFTNVKRCVPISDVEFEEIEVPVRLRRFIQLDESNMVPTYFKSFGDPRTLSSRTGTYYSSVAELNRSEPGTPAATEIYHFKLDFLNTSYGVPRWIGAMYEVFGSRSASKVNYLFFKNKSVPPLAILVSGGVLATGAVERIKHHIDNNMKGEDNYHKILVLEADSDGKSQNVRIEIKQLTESQLKDALFQNYDENNISKISAQFRLPRIVRGDTRDFNRATADAALRFAEDNVFGPLREDFDRWMNGVLLPSMGIHTIVFNSLTPVTKEPERLSKILALMVEKGILLPKEARRFAQDVFNMPLEDIKEDWVKRPLPFVLAGIQTGTGTMDGAQIAAPLEVAKSLLNLEEQLSAEREKLNKNRLDMTRKILHRGDAKDPLGADDDAEDRVVLKIPPDEFESLFESMDAEDDD